MTPDSARLLAQYNTYANRLMNQHISQLSLSQWEKELGGYYPSVKSLCLHLYTADINWLKRFGLVRPFEVLKNPLFAADNSWDAALFGSIDEYLRKRAELDGLLEAFTQELSEDDLQKTLSYKNWKGVDQVRNVGGLVLHVFNHQTHHRGMISLYLELLGVENDFSSLSALA